LFAMYFTLRSTVPRGVGRPRRRLLERPVRGGEHARCCCCGSVTCQMGVWAAERFQPVRSGSLLNVRSWGMNEWMTLTYIMGAFFIGGQIFEYAELVHEGLTISSSPYGSVFYLTTGFHGLHVVGGLIAFLFLLGRSFTAKRFGHHEATTAIVTSYYWHFVDVVWIALFATIYLIK
ncbi:heme-copper oxidase subunit III, partial [Agrobacterium sp. S2]|nr:heme-copper oxidase subunit III [Agrobacterium sp. S2]